MLRNGTVGGLSHTRSFLGCDRLVMSSTSQRRLLATTSLASALVCSGALLLPANAACDPTINGPGTFTATVSCTSAAAASMTVVGPSTITIGTAGTNVMGIEMAVTNPAANATATVSNVTIVNNNVTGGNSIGINVATAAGGTTGNAVLNMSGTNSITTANGNVILANARGSTGNATITIEGNVNFNSLAVNNNTQDGVEATVRGGTASIDMSNATGNVTVHGGNGIFIDSLPVSGSGVGNGNLIGNIGAVTVTMDNTVSGAGGLVNSGIQMTTGGLGTTNLTTSATIITLGPLADAIQSLSGAGLVNLTNSGAISVAGADSNGIDAIKSNGNNNSQALTIINSGAITTTGTTASSGIIASSSNSTTTSTGAVGDISITNSGDISTAGSLSYGIAATTSTASSTASGAITIDNSAAIATTGANSDAIHAVTSIGSMGATITNSGVIQTSGAGANGILAMVASGPVVIDNSGSIATAGANSDAIHAVTSIGSMGATITNSGAIQTSGAGANGILATVASGAIVIDNSGSITSTLGDGVLALATAAGATLELRNEGRIFGDAGVEIGNNFATAQIDNSGTIGASDDFAIDSHTLTTGPLTINNSGTITGFMTLGAGINTLNNSGTWDLRNFSATTGTLGVAVADFGTSGSNVINNTGTIRLLGAPVAGAPVDSTGQYLPLAAGTVVNATASNPLNAMAAGGPVQGQILGVQTFNNSGIIDLTANPVAGDVLVISGGHTAGTDGGGVFVANGGTLRLNTVLNEGGAASQSDMLVVDSTRLGSAPTSIVVNNFGGGGAQTVGDGIALVEVLNKGASADGVFALSGRVAAGAFDYDLFHNGVGADAADGNWYLRTTGVRPEVPPDTVVPAIASRLGLAMLGTYSSRYADIFNGNGNLAAQYCGDVETRKAGIYTKAPPANDQCNTLLWGRIFGETGSAGGGIGSNGGFGNSGPAYSFDYGGFQAGADLYRTARDNAGLYAGVATARSGVMAASGGEAGRLSMDAYGFGGYWTHRDPGGWYTDLVLQGNWYENIHTASVEGVNFHTQGWGITASAETGYRVTLGDGYSVIPQGQIIYQRTDINSGVDPFARISFAATDEVYGRLGGRLARGWLTNDGRTVTAWMDTSIWHQFGDNAQTSFASLQGNFPTSFGVGLGGTWAQVGLGLSGQLMSNVGIFGKADYNIALNQPGHSLGGRAGVRVSW